MGVSRDVTARELAGLSGTALPYAVPIGDPFQQMFGIGRTTQWRLIEDGEVESVLIGVPGRAEARSARPGRGRRVIIVTSYLAYMERQQQREIAGEIEITSPNPRAREHATNSKNPSRGSSPGNRPPSKPRKIERPIGTAPRQKYRTRRSS